MNKVVTQFIGIDGQQYNDDCSSVYAKLETSERSTKTFYYVKKVTRGMQAGHLVDPWSIFEKPGEERQFDNRIGKHTFEYVSVNKVIFDLYIRYLQTKNTLYYRQAERAMD
jgi:hypothetical protein